MAREQTQTSDQQQFMIDRSLSDATHRAATQNPRPTKCDVLACKQHSSHQILPQGNFKFFLKM
jgi:hypothetical protein